MVRTAAFTTRSGTTASVIVVVNNECVVVHVHNGCAMLIAHDWHHQHPRFVMKPQLPGVNVTKDDSISTMAALASSGLNQHFAPSALVIRLATFRRHRHHF